MRYPTITRLAATLGLAILALGPAQAAEKHLTILMSVPDLAFPFFVHCIDQGKQEANKLGDIDLLTSDGQRSSPKQTADI
jgi:inositol transport system substrate-binding protein